VALQAASSVTGVSTDNSGIDFQNIIPSILGKFVDVLFAALILVIAYFVTRYVRARLSKIIILHENQKNAVNLLEKLINGFIIVISATLALKVIGLDMTLLVSVCVLGLSYGLQDIIKNYVAGILILFKAPFKIGDTIKIRDYTGKVDKIDFQSTTLKTFDRKDVTIYNSDVMTQSIINFSRNDMRRVDIDVQLGYGTDTTAAFKTFENIMGSDTHILKNPGHHIVFKKFAESSVIFTLKGWVKMPANIPAIKTNLAQQIQAAFNESTIYMPYVKGIEAESDFTLTEERKARLAPPVIVEPEVALTAAELSIQVPDYDEPE